MWNKSLIEGEFALLQSVGGDNGCDSSEPAFQTAGMKHVMELAALLRRQRAPQPFSNWECECSPVLSSQPSILQQIKGKLNGLNQKFFFSVFFVMDFLTTI